MKFLLLTTGRRKIKYLSEAYCGSSHDYAILKTELPVEDRLWFDDHHLYVDLGFLGINKDYAIERISIPFKKSKNKGLTEEQKMTNKQYSSIRVKVEHSIGGFKRYRFLSDRLRCRNIALYNLVAGICAGIWNFCLSD
ncbi:MAG: transposase family protein [Saprospiraceae bacterium]